MLRPLDPRDITSRGVAVRLLVAFATPPAVLTLIYRLTREPDGLNLTASSWAGQAVLLLIGLAFYVPGIVAVSPLHQSFWGAVTFTIIYSLTVTAFIVGFGLWFGGGL